MSAGLLAPFLVYSVLSITLLGRVCGNLSRSYVGPPAKGDPISFMWLLAWWPHALLHRLDPFLSDVIYAPVGINLAWVTSIPGASLLASPLTMTWGPVVAYNVLCLLAPPLAALSAFILCRYLTKAFWPSLAGGFIFGFSPYVTGHLLGHLNLILVFVIPLCVHLVLLRLHNAIRPVVFTLLLALALIVQFSFSIEVFATMTLFGGALLGIVFVRASGTARRQVTSTVVLVSYAYGIAALVHSLYVYHLFAHGVPRSPVFPPEIFSSVLHNFLIPTPTTYIGQHWYDWFGSVVGKHPQVPDEETAYLGAPLLAILFLFGLRTWSKPVGKLLILSFAAVCIASLGPDLRVHGHPLIPLPWKVFTYLPLIHHALPGRFMVYAFLIAAVVVAIWSTSPRTSRWERFTLLPLAVLFLLPNPTFSGWRSELEIPSFFTGGAYRQYLKPGETTMVVPFGHHGQSMLWQSLTDMYFRMPDGYTGPVGPPDREWPVLDAIIENRFPLERKDELKAFLTARGVTAIVVAENTPGPWKPLFSSLATEPVYAGGVAVYRVRGALAKRRDVVPYKLEHGEEEQE